MLVKDIMNYGAVTIAPNDTLYDAIDLVNEMSVSSYNSWSFCSAKDRLASKVSSSRFSGMKIDLPNRIITRANGLGTMKRSQLLKTHFF